MLFVVVSFWNEEEGEKLLLLFPPDICGALVAILPTRAERLFENPVEGLMLLLLFAFVVVNGVADIDIDDDVGGGAE